MGLKDILVHVDSTPASDLRHQLGISLARHFGARLSDLNITPGPDGPTQALPERVAVPVLMFH